MTNTERQELLERWHHKGASLWAGIGLASAVSIVTAMHKIAAGAAGEHAMHVSVMPALVYGGIMALTTLAVVINAFIGGVRTGAK